MADDSLRRYDYAGGALKRLDAPQRSPEGFVRYQGVSTRAGVFEYPQADGSVRLELRPPEWVGHPESLGAMAPKPFTNRHPAPGEVTPQTWRSYARGSTPESVFDPETDEVLSTVDVGDAESIAQIDSGEAAELSWGYHLVRLDKAPPGSTYKGQPYTHIQVGPYKYNHLAHVPEGRAGEGARLRLDHAGGLFVPPPSTETEPPPAGASPTGDPDTMGDKNKKTLRLDAFAIEEDGKYVVRQGLPPFDALSNHASMEEADAEVARLHAENMPDEKARGQAALDAYKAHKAEMAKMDADKAEAAQQVEAARQDAASLRRERDQLKARLDAKEGQTSTTPEEVARQVKAGVEAEVTARLDAAQKAWPMLPGDERAKGQASLLKLPAEAIKTKAIGAARPELRLDGQSDAYRDELFDRLAAQYAASSQHLEDLFSAVHGAEKTQRQDEKENGGNRIEAARKNKYENLGPKRG